MKACHTYRSATGQQTLPATGYPDIAPGSIDDLAGRRSRLTRS